MTQIRLAIATVQLINSAALEGKRWTITGWYEDHKEDPDIIPYYGQPTTYASDLVGAREWASNVLEMTTDYRVVGWDPQDMFVPFLVMERHELTIFSVSGDQLIEVCPSGAHARNLVEQINNGHSIKLGPTKLGSDVIETTYIKGDMICGVMHRIERVPMHNM